MINNRQGGRRRGRGGQQPRGISGGNSGGNARDNRQRGNAAQLLEKYKSMARDSQLAGDRVQTEYYLQFADHYFRVLGESRSRFDEQRRQRGDDDGDQDGDDDDRMDAEMDGDQDTDADHDDPRQQPLAQQQRGRPDDAPPRRARPAADRAEPRRDRPNGRVRDDDDARGNGGSRGESAHERIDFAVLPPAIGADDNGPSDDRDDDAPRPKRRARRPRADDQGSDDASAA